MVNAATRIGRSGDHVASQSETGVRSRWANDMGARSYGRRPSDAMPVSSPGALDDPIAAAPPIVTARLALHGGGEFLPGDETFLDALLGAVPARPGANGVLRAVVVATAAAPRLTPLA